MSTVDAIREAADFNVDLIPEPYDELYRAMGYDGFAALFDYLGGRTVYVPTMRKVLADCIRSAAVEECARGVLSTEKVARKYGYTPRYLRKVVKDSKAP